MEKMHEVCILDRPESADYSNSWIIISCRHFDFMLVNAFMLMVIWDRYILY